MRCLEKPVLRARTGCEISALHGNWSAVQPGGLKVMLFDSFIGLENARGWPE